jgi:hypothetical protein
LGLRGFVGITALALVVAGPSWGAAGPVVTQGPVPSWVEPLRADVAPDPARVDGGREFLLVDDQARALPRFDERYRHFAIRIATRAAVEDVSQLQIDVDPAYEHLTLHGVWIHRGKRRINALHLRQVRLLQRETGLDSQMLDGTKTALLFLPDVRVGDVLEYSYTLRGRNPVFGAHAQLGATLQYEAAVGRRYVRFLWPEGRPVFLQVRGPGEQPVVGHRGGDVEYVSDHKNLPALPVEDGVPSSVEPLPRLELSDFGTWQEVSRWGAALYPHAPLSPAMKKLVAGWRALPEAERFLAALRFTQDEIRYLGLELGTNSHRPHAPAQVVARRFGDCKDKSYLLVELLRALGIPAVPALANTRLREGVAKLWPSARAFDHVIVRAQVAGKPRWVDPTRTLERGPLEAQDPPTLGQVLPLTAQGAALETLPLPALALPQIDLLETFDASRRDGTARLSVVTTYRGRSANAMRNRVSAERLADLTRDNLNAYVSTYPGIRSRGENVVVDLPASNVITVSEEYTLQHFWKDGQHHFDAGLIEDYLPKPRTTTRTLPLAVVHPVKVHSAIRATLPEAVHPPHDQGTQVTAGGTLRYDLREEGKMLLLDYTYVSSAHSIAADKVPAYLAELDTLRGDLGYRVALAPPGASPVEHSDADTNENMGCLLALVVIGVLALHFGLRARGAGDRQQAFQRQFDIPEGSSAARAFRVASLELDRVHARLTRCDCGAPFSAASEREIEEGVILGDRRITPVRVRCESCGASQRVHFEVLGDIRHAS